MGSGGNLAKKIPGALNLLGSHTLLSVRTCHQEPRGGNWLDTGLPTVHSQWKVHLTQVWT